MPVTIHIKPYLNIKNILSGRQSYWYKNDILERITHIVLNNFLYLHGLQKKCVNTSKGSIRKLYNYINTIFILSTSYLPTNLIPPSQLNEMISQVKKGVLETNSEFH